MNDDDLLAAFESCDLPKSHIDHRVHVRIAFLYLRRLGYDDAVDALRTGFKKTLAALGVPDTPTSGYNETTTVAFARIIHAVMQVHDTSPPAPTSDDFCDRHPEVMTAQILRLYYSPARRADVAAKTTFVEPDLAPLPSA